MSARNDAADQYRVVALTFSEEAWQELDHSYREQLVALACDFASHMETAFPQLGDIDVVAYPEQVRT